MNTTPPFLSKGNKIGLIAPSGKLANDQILDYAINIFEDWGLEVVLGINLFKKHHSFAGTEEQRASDLQEMLDNKDIKAIFCARGGYGCTRIVDNIDFSSFIKYPKWIIGYSDITTLLCHIYNLEIESIHGLMPAQYKNKRAKNAIEGIKKILFGGHWSLESNSSHPLNKTGISKAEIIGGNLSILNDIIGTNSDINTENKILFIEEVDEYVYHIDRIMTHLFRAGKLERLAGIVVGYISSIRKNTTNPFAQTVFEVIFDKVKPFDYPVCFNFPFGHQPNNLPLICGREVTFFVDKYGGKINFNPS